jgi:16S rRNA (guanine(966)-N(2))-methyltransferase RsmD
VRPTSSRVREALFSILGQQMGGLHVLDLFAGAGTLGIEAVSRGATSVLFVEADQGHAGLLRRNVGILRDLSVVRVEVGEVQQVLPRLAAEGLAFDIVFLDPPYGRGLAQESLLVLDRLPGLLRGNARVVCESGGGELLPDRVGGLPASPLRRYGETQLHFYSRIEDP